MAGTIIKGEEHFFTNLYEGNGGGQRVGNFVPFTDNVTIDKSCIFDSASNGYLSRTPGSAGNRKTFTISFWVKRGRLGDQAGSNTYGQRIFHAADSSSAFFDIKFSGSGDTEGANRLHIREYSSSAEQIQYWTNRTFEDTSKWYNIVVQVNTTDSTSSDRIKVYVDGDEVTSWYRSSAPSLNLDTLVNSTVAHHLGRFVGATSNNLDAYLAEFNLVDGSIVAPSTFGLTDTSTGRWIPKSLTGITYGTNGFRMEFANTAGQTIGDDTSGNTNDYAVTNIATTDITTDSPTQNHATLSSLSAYKSSNFTLSEGNLKATSTSTSGTHSGQGVMRIPSGGKYYWECEIDSGKDGMAIGIIPTDTQTTSANPSTATLYLSSGAVRTTGSDSLSYGSGVNNGDIMGFALDLSDKNNGKLYVSVNGTYENSGNPVTGANPAPSKVLKGDFRVIYQDGSNGYAPVYIFNFGQKSFNTSPPTGYSALQQDNLPETGKGVADIVWIKNRDATDNNQWYDSSRGPLNRLKTNSTDGEDVVSDGLQKFLKGGAAIEDDNEINTAGESYVSWNWVVGGGTTSANTDGVGATVACTIQKNTTAGISIVEWTGGGSAGTIEHGLGQVPAWMMYKRKNADGDGWIIYHHKLNSGSPEDGHISLQTTHTFSNDATMWNDTAPTTQLATIGTYGMQNTEKRVGYFFAEIPGFSKFGDFTGNANSDGPFVYLGFKPKFILFKAQTSAHWAIHDSTRDQNQNNQVLYSSLTSAESSNSSRGLDFLSNGFKIRQESGYNLNYSGTQCVYFAFAEHPFNGDGSTAFATAV